MEVVNQSAVETQPEETVCEEPRILEEIQIEELAIDGICGVY
jgi:mycofactocin precursor